jgi:hypothetical protein
MQTFAFVHCILSIHQHLGIFCTTQVGLQFGTTCPNISIKHECELQHPKGSIFSYYSMQINFLFPKQVEKKQVYCFQTL